jgi:undecaprenyl-diphosphatase
VVHPDVIPEPISWLDALILGLVEGVTEFLPISSTGHLILTNRVLGIPESPLTIGIQLGAITAILVLYWKDLWLSLTRALAPASAGPRHPNLLLQILVAALPAAVLGLLFGDDIENYLFSPGFVGSTLFVGGILLIVLERVMRKRNGRQGMTLAETPYRAAFYIGLWQCLALLPGTSRSGATIAGALLLGLSRPAAAELSFLVGLPILYGACMLEMIEHSELVFGEYLVPMAVGTASAFVSALVVVIPFVRYLRTHTFVAFGAYRILLGMLVGALCWEGLL